MADGDVFLSPSLNNRRLSFHRQRQQALCATSNTNHQQTAPSNNKVNHKTAGCEKGFCHNSWAEVQKFFQNFHYSQTNIFNSNHSSSLFIQLVRKHAYFLVIRSLFCCFCPDISVKSGLSTHKHKRTPTHLRHHKHQRERISQDFKKKTQRS